MDILYTRVYVYMPPSIYMDGKPLTCCENCFESCMILVHLSGYSTRMCLDCAEIIQTGDDVQ